MPNSIFGADGEKRFLYQGKVKGGRLFIGEPENGKPLWGSQNRQPGQNRVSANMVDQAAIFLGYFRTPFLRQEKGAGSIIFTDKPIQAPLIYSFNYGVTLGS